MIVYRFERNGIGPYVSRTSVNILNPTPRTRTANKYSMISSKYPLDYDAYSRAHSSKKYIYGCSSKEQLRVYFNGNFKDLFKHGFRIKRYKVPDKDVIDMGSQVAFPVRYHKLRNIRNLEKAVK